MYKIDGSFRHSFRWVYLYNIILEALITKVNSLSCYYFWCVTWNIFLFSNPVKRKLQDLLMFMTGACHIPPLGFPKAIVVDFYSYGENEYPGFGRLPWVSTCDLSICLPRGVADSDIFSKIFDEAITSAKGFGKV